MVLPVGLLSLTEVPVLPHNRSGHRAEENKKFLKELSTCIHCIHLRSLNIRHFGMVEAMGLNMWRRGLLQWHYLTTKFHENP
jgi:hypothetical protein